MKTENIPLNLTRTLVVGNCPLGGRHLVGIFRQIARGLNCKIIFAKGGTETSIESYPQDALEKLLKPGTDLTIRVEGSNAKMGLDLLTPLIAATSGKTEAVKRASRTVIVRNELGFHSRPSHLFAMIASSFRSEIILEKDGEKVDGKEMFSGIYMLACGPGAELTIHAVGPDSEEAVSALSSLAENPYLHEISCS